jgi:hypothetical protein
MSNPLETALTRGITAAEAAMVEQHNRTGKTQEELRPAQLATDGTGPLFQRDYVAVLEGATASPEDAVRHVRADFPSFSPSELAEFSRPEGENGPLQVGDTMHVLIRGAGHCGVRVTLVEPRSLTLRTLEGHIEAGRITFGAEQDETGRVILRIRSRSRISSPARYVGYEMVGKHAQTRIWVTFLERWAERCGGRIVGQVLLAWDRVEESPADTGETERPTFRTDTWSAAGQPSRAEPAARAA